MKEAQNRHNQRCGGIGNQEENHTGVHRGPIESSGRWDPINGVNNGKSNFSPKVFRDRGRKEQSSHSV
jgi:hypothetical protein